MDSTSTLAITLSAKLKYGDNSIYIRKPRVCLKCQQIQHQLEWHPVLRLQLLEKLWLFCLSKPVDLNRQLTEEMHWTQNRFFTQLHLFKLGRKSCPSLSFSFALLSPPQDSVPPKAGAQTLPPALLHGWGVGVGRRWSYSCCMTWDNSLWGKTFKIRKILPFSIIADC